MEFPSSNVQGECYTSMLETLFRRGGGPEPQFAKASPSDGWAQVAHSVMLDHSRDPNVQRNCCTVLE